MTYTARILSRADFTMKYDDTHAFDFFEDEQADHLWAYGTIDAAEFANQANQYDALCDAIYEDGYTAKDVRYITAVARSFDHPHQANWSISPCDMNAPGAVLVAVIDR